MGSPEERHGRAAMTSPRLNTPCLPAVPGEYAGRRGARQPTAQPAGTVAAPARSAAGYKSSELNADPSYPFSH